MGVLVAAMLALTMIPMFSFHFLPAPIQALIEPWLGLEVGGTFAVGMTLLFWDLWGRHTCPRCQARNARFKVPKEAQEWFLTCASCGLNRPTGWQCGD